MDARSYVTEQKEALNTRRVYVATVNAGISGVL